jgi:hypothetical protein
MTRCNCCGATHSPEELLKLPLVGLQDDGAGGLLTLRNCPCGSTISAELEPPTSSIACCARCGRCEEVRAWRGLEVCGECAMALIDWAQSCEAGARAYLSRRLA